MEQAATTLAQGAGERLASVAPRICDQQIGMRAKLRDHLQRSSFVWGRTGTTLRAKWPDLPTQVIEDPYYHSWIAKLAVVESPTPAEQVFAKS